jgi:hypothetical protein
MMATQKKNSTYHVGTCGETTWNISTNSEQSKTIMSLKKMQMSMGKKNRAEQHIILFFEVNTLLILNKNFHKLSCLTNNFNLHYDIVHFYFLGIICHKNLHTLLSHLPTFSEHSN